MTPWHRFWFPDDEASRHVQHDAALWSPNALTELHQSFWHQAAEATAQWWRFVSIAWPSLPVQQSPGSVLPSPVPKTTDRPRAAARPKTASTKARPARKVLATATQRPHSVKRGK